MVMPIGGGSWAGDPARYGPGPGPESGGGRRVRGLRAQRRGAGAAEGEDEARGDELGELAFGGVVRDLEEALVVSAGEGGTSDEKAEEAGLAGRQAAREEEGHQASVSERGTRLARRRGATEARCTTPDMRNNSTMGPAPGPVDRRCGATRPLSFSHVPLWLAAEQ